MDIFNICKNVSSIRQKTWLFVNLFANIKKNTFYNILLYNNSVDADQCARRQLPKLTENKDTDFYEFEGKSFLYWYTVYGNISDLD